jgi:hypothetical protein
MRNLLLGLLPALVLCGCWDGPSEKPIKVEGRILLDGIPLKGALVTFVPRGGQGRLARGDTSREGDFLLTTSTPYDGVLPGNYKVTVTFPGKDEQALPGPDRNRALAKGQSVLESIEPWHNPVPVIYGDEASTPLEQEIPAPTKVIVLELHSPGNP